MNKYILLLGVAGVAFGSYCAYAGNSATMTVTATIAHYVSLSVTQDIELGTINLNPASMGGTYWGYNSSGVYSKSYGNGIVSAPNATVGAFSANIPNPEDCNIQNDSCGGLSISASGRLFGSEGDCDFKMIHNSGYDFTLYPAQCYIGDRTAAVSVGAHEIELTINYSPS